MLPHAVIGVGLHVLYDMCLCVLQKAIDQTLEAVEICRLSHFIKSLESMIYFYHTCRPKEILMLFINQHQSKSCVPMI